jgi:hypothetical protein
VVYKRAFFAEWGRDAREALEVTLSHSKFNFLCEFQEKLPEKESFS